MLQFPIFSLFPDFLARVPFKSQWKHCALPQFTVPDAWQTQSGASTYGWL